MEIEIVSYIKEARQHGLSDQEIKQNLLDVGWNPGEVEDSFVYVKLPDNSTPQHALVQPANPVQTQPAAVHQQIPPVAIQPIKQPAPAVEPKPAVMPAQMPPLSLSTQPAQKFSLNSAPTGQSLPQQTPATAPRFPGQVPAEALKFSGQQTAPTAAPASLSDTHFTKPNPAKKILMIVGVLILVILLAGGGYFAYGYFTPTPAKIWNAFAKTPKSKIGKSTFTINYNDPGIPDSSGKPQAFSFGLKGATYSDTTNASSTISSSDLTLSYQVPQIGVGVPQSGSLNFKLQILGDNLYADLSNIPGLTNAGQPITWVKLNLTDLQNLAASSPYASSMNTQMQNQKQIQAKIQADLENILKGKQVISPVKILGTETISGVSTYHLQNQVDKPTLKAAFSAIFDDAYASSSLSQIAAAGAIKQVILSSIDRITIASFETWIGKKDSQLYKIHIDLKFPGVESWVDDGNNPLGVARAESRDAKRVADMRQMASALELFYNDHNGYPASQNGSAVGIAPMYIGVPPTAPTPSDGDCSDYYNAYWYSASGTPTTNNGLLVYPSYTMTFCLGGQTGTFAPGIAKLSPTGIQAAVACTDKPENCHKQVDVQQTPAAPAVPAELTIDVTQSDLGKTETVTPPANPLDLVKYIQQQMSASPMLQTVSTSTMSGLH